MSNITITGLYVYPIKSCAGLSLESAALGPRGFHFDRQWMIVQDDVAERGMFLTQRQLPRMALIQPGIDGDTLVVRAPGMSALTIPLAQRVDAPTLPVVVWRDTCIAADEGETAAAWVSEFLGLQARLVRMEDRFVRPVDPNYARQPAQTGFSDGFPLLLISQASLGDLNQRLSERGKAAVPMNRFRPNIVVEGCDAYAEDSWGVLQHGDLKLEVVKSCARCAITTVDQPSGTIPDREEPLATLATYRRGERGVLFGQNVIHRGDGSLRLGDVLTLTES